MHDIAAPEKPSEPVAVLTLRVVKPGSEGKFEEALHDFISQSFQTEGQLGVSVIRPVEGSGSREYGILRRFRDAASRDRFYDSSLFKQWDITVASFTEGETQTPEPDGPGNVVCPSGPAGGDPAAPLEDGPYHRSGRLADQYLRPVGVESFHEQYAFCPASTFCRCRYSDPPYLGGHAAAGEDSQAIAIIRICGHKHT